MGQQEVLNELKKNKKKWISSLDFKAMNFANPSSVNCSLMKLRIYGDVDWKKKRVGSRDMFFYKHKKRS